jgi:Flp pilus assembly pilin Flp
VQAVPLSKVRAISQGWRGVKYMLSYLIDLHSRAISVLRREEGQGLTEYALILFFVSIVAILALTFLGTQITSVLSAAGKAI